MASQTRSLDNTVSAEWANPDYAFAENDLCTTAAGDGDQSVYNIINIPFTIPSGANIDGIEVKTIRATDENDYYEIELQDKIPAWKLKTGTSNLAVCADAAPETLGSPTDDWGGSWDAGHINSSSFQIRLTYQKVAKSNTPSVDHIEVVIYYTEAGGQEYFETPTETLNLTDFILKQQTLSRAHAESINLSDNILKNITKKISETVNLSDSVLRRSSFVRTLTETVTLSDSILDALTFLRSFAETLALTDTVIPTKLYTKTLTETLALADSILGQLIIYRILLETLILTDSVLTSQTLFRTYGETITLTDIVTPSRILIKTLAETMGLTDTIIRAWASQKLLEEAITPIDVLIETYIAEIAAVAYIKILTEIIAPNDVVLKLLTLSRTLTETVALSDALLASRYLVLTEMLILADVIHGTGKDIAATVELSLVTKKMMLDMCKKTDELAFLVKEMILKRRV